jgi:hypothetical protein
MITASVAYALKNIGRMDGKLDVNAALCNKKGREILLALDI